jgi:hypothetical protein
MLSGEAECGGRGGAGARCARACFVVALAAVLLPGAGRPAAAQDVTIEQVEVEGINTNGIVFVWTVTNKSRKALNHFEVPVYNINTFEAPEGWKVVSAPRLAHGTFVAHTDEPIHMLRLGQPPAEFKASRPLQDNRLDGRVTLKLGFVDGQTLEIANVLAPVKQSLWEAYLVPGFLGGLLILVWVFRSVRSSRRRASGAGVGAGA